MSKWREAAKIYRQQKAKDSFDPLAQVQKLQEFLNEPEWKELLEASGQKIPIGYSKTELGDTLEYYLTHNGPMSTFAMSTFAMFETGSYFMRARSAREVVNVAYQNGITDVCEFIKGKLDEIADKVL